MSGVIVVIKYLIRSLRSLNKVEPAPASSAKSTPNNNVIDDNKYWIIDGKLYDLTPFLELHPGGKHILLINRGRDCTELFFSYHLASSKNIQYMLGCLKQYYVRDATPEQVLSPFSWTGKNLDMYVDFKGRIQQYFIDNKEPLGERRDKATLSRLIWYAFLIFSLFMSYIYAFSGRWIALIPLPFIHWLLQTELLHNGTHYQIVRNATVNIFMGIIGGFYHAPNIQWEMQHVISHHSYTNIHDLDVDLNHFLDNFRTSEVQPYKEIYKSWKSFFPIYVLAASLGQIDSWGARVERNIHRLMVPYWNKNSQWNTTRLLYVIQVGWIFGVPFLMWCYWGFGLLNFGKACLFELIPRIGHGVLFYIFSQVSHIQSDAFYDGEMAVTDNWLVHQIQSSVDYSIHSTFWNFMSLGLNNQSIHHLCPSIHICHFKDLQPLLDQFCDDYHIKRTVFPNIYDTLKAHWKHLCNVNDPCAEKKVQ